MTKKSAIETHRSWQAWQITYTACRSCTPATVYSKLHILRLYFLVLNFCITFHSQRVYIESCEVFIMGLADSAAVASLINMAAVASIP